MGSDLHVVVWAAGPAAEHLADLAVMRVDLLESCWSRFRLDSELTRLNACAHGVPVPVSEDLHRLVAALRAAWEWSEGDVDATVLGSMVAMGYDADFALVASAPPSADWQALPAGGMAEVLIESDRVTLPVGVGLDPGAIGKGLAGDIVSAEIAAAGAEAVLIALGGDVVTHGVPPDAGAWRISVRDDRTAEREELHVIDLSGEHCSVATSSVLRRRWADRHHVLRPSSGRPTDSDVLQATVVADAGWRAEAGATLALIRGRGSASWLASRNCTAYLLGGPHA